MPHVVAVIHHLDEVTSLANARVAAESGCRGIALIQMDGRDDEIDGAAVRAMRAHPSLLVGANRLSCSPAEAVARNVELGLAFTWSDSSGVTSRGTNSETARISEALAVPGREGHLFFGGVAFKGQGFEPDPVAAAARAAKEGWIVTTSGPGTGYAPDEAKLEGMAGAVGRDRLAVASGIGPGNARILARHVGWVFSATGISRTFHEFDRELVRALVEECVAIGT